MLFVRTPAGPAHVAFCAPSHSAVNSFFYSALRAGGEIFGEPTIREPKTGYYSAGVLDLDRNSIEVVYRPTESLEEGMALTRISEYPVENRITVHSEANARSAVSQNSSTQRSPLRTIVNNLTMPTRVIQQEQGSRNDSITKTIIGTLLGAAAGAAIAYAVSSAEPKATSSPSFEHERQIVYQTIDEPVSASRVERSPTSYYPLSPSLHAPSYISQQSHRSSSSQRAIEAPRSATSNSTVIRSSQEVVHYESPPPQSPRSSIMRSQSAYLSPDRIPLPRSPSVRSVVSSGARTITQADFLPVSSGRTSQKTSIASCHEDQNRPCSRGSGRSNHRVVSPPGPIVEEVGDVDIDGSLAPSDSISQAGSNRLRHRHKSRHGGRSRSQRSEGGKRSVVSLPVREIHEERRGLGRRSVVSQILRR